MTTKKSIYAENIKNTGFVLEYEISKILKDRGWQVINNKYYIDDVEETAREIDIVAYKANTFDGIVFYTSLIISCKKSTKNVWALISQDKNDNDPNKDWHPYSFWTNQKIYTYMYNKKNHQISYMKEDKDLYKNIFEIRRNIYAFQEMSKNDGKANNDSNMFASVVSLMKCLSHETRSFEKKKKQKRFYNFNLISIVDSELIALEMKDKSIDEIEIDDDKYLFDYIINENSVKSRIHFLRASAFKRIIQEYDKLHIHNLEHLKKTKDLFYKDSVKDSEKLKLLEANFVKRLRWIYYYTARDFLKDEDDLTIHLRWNDTNSLLEVEVGNQDYSNDDEIRKVLSEDTEIIERTATALKEIYNYEGKFQIEAYMRF